VIETNARLSKTLQIFNAINTTGLDLNGGDIFKLRMFEYLKNKKGKDDNAFNEISKLYEKIDSYNKDAKYDVTNINEILEFYKYILIAKYDLPIVLYSYGTDTFYERLFDTIFNNYQWEHFKNNVNNLELSLEEIDQLIEARYKWENNWYLTAEDMFCYKIIEYSRYSKYADLLPVILLYSNLNCDIFNFVRKLSRVYFIYSVRFQKAINEIHSWTYELIKDIINNNLTGEELLSKIKDKIGNEGTHNTGYYDLNWFISENLTDNTKRKYLVCLLSAMLEEEDYKTSSKKKIDELETSFWKTEIDIEHIQSYHDEDENKREKIWNEWGNELNSIGNLMILERNKNRSIRNKQYNEKIKCYGKSKFSIVKKQVECYPEWTLEKCQERKKAETKKLLNYLFE
jgi:hypothetical protein